MKTKRLKLSLYLLFLSTSLSLLSCTSEKTSEQEISSKMEENMDNKSTKGVEHLVKVEGDYIFLQKEKDNFYRFDASELIEKELLIGNYASPTEIWYIGEIYVDSKDDKQYDISKAYANSEEIIIKGINNYDNEENLTTTFMLSSTNNENVWHLSDLEHEPKGRFITLKEHKDDFEIMPFTDMAIILKSIPLSFTPLTEMTEGEIEGEWVFYEECHYGTGGFSISETGDYIHFSGGGDGTSYSITEMEKLENDVTITFKEDFSEGTQQLTIENIYADYSTIKCNLGWIVSSRYVSDKSQGDFYTVTEPCDE